MKVTFISPYEDLMAYGIRILSAYLKKQGFSTEIIFVPGILNQTASYSIDALADAIKEKIFDSCLVGMSFFSCHLDVIKRLTRALGQRTDIPVVWGGKHISMKPEDAIGYVDIVSVGEAEHAIKELLDAMVENRDITDIHGLWFVRDGHLKKNPLCSIVDDLDQLPFPDYDLETQYLWDGAAMHEMTEVLLYKYSKLKGKVIYQTLASRGCPYNCTYCSTFKNLYPDTRYLRFRSPRNLVEELKEIISRFPGIQTIALSDDNFFAFKEKQMQVFARLYKDTVGLPFRCLSHCRNITEQKLKVLVDAGMNELQVGIQTGSENTRKLYRRGPTSAKVLDAVRLIHQFKDSLMPYYDFIVDNPFEQDKDLVETLHMIQQFPRPYHVNVFSLIFIPGTRLHQMAMEKGLVFDETKQFGASRRTYINFVFYLYGRMPRWVTAILISRPMLAAMENRYVVGFLYSLRDGARKTVRLLAGPRR